MKIDQRAKHKGMIVSIVVTVLVIAAFAGGIGYMAVWYANSNGSCTAHYIRHTDGAVTETDCS